MPPPAVVAQSTPPLPQRRPHQRPGQRITGPGQRGPQPAAPQLPENVRYLFKPVLTTSATSAGDTSDKDIANKDHSPGRRPAEPASSAFRKPVEFAGSAPARAGSRRRTAWIAAAAFVLVAVAGTTVVLARHGTVHTGVSHPGRTARRAGGKTLAGMSDAAIVRSDAARWIVTAVSRSAIIACDDVMCSELYNEGLSASNLVVLSPTAPDPLGADLVVGTPALRSQFGGRLASEYAPLLLASFGTGRTRVDVRVIAPDGGAAYERALGRDVAARRAAGRLLVSNSRITLSASSAAELAAGQVDPRLLVMLPVLAAQHPVQVVAFYDHAPRSGPGVPLSGVELSAASPMSGLTGTAYRRWLVRFLLSQRPPYRAVSVGTQVRSHRKMVFVRFAQPSPIGLLNGFVGGGHES